jgi:hypothetical protein
VDTQTNGLHCGGCDRACTAPENAQASCSAGQCAFACADGYTSCPGEGCVDTRSDAANCGACGIVCPGAANGTAVCASGTCAVTCHSGFTNCGGKCCRSCLLCL